MENLLLSVIVILLLIIFVLSAKIYFLHKASQKIITAFKDKLDEATNTLIDISSHDPYMKKLASDINVQLRLLRRERHRYQQGDSEQKEAITNISNESVRRYLSQIRNRKNLSGALDRSRPQFYRSWIIYCKTSDRTHGRDHCSGLF